MSLSPVFGGGLFPWGTHVYREPCLDLDGVLRDLPLLKDYGFNMIKIQEHWSADERREGDYDFSRLEQVLRRADELDLGVYLGLTMEQAPAWLWRKYPDCHFVYSDGRRHNQPTQYTIPMDGKPGPCWDHPGARKAAARFIAELARTLGQYKNIWAWNTFQEIGFWPNTAGKLGFCYCPHTLARFREWLRGKYKTLAQLNATWQINYASWDEVEPPRREEPLAPFIDWRYFMDDVYMARQLAFKTEALRAHDPYRRPVFSHADTPRVGSGAEWRWARVGDFFGTSNYPKWNNGHPWDDPVENEEGALRNEIWEEMMLCTDLARGANGRDRALWGAEFQGGPISTSLHFGRTPTPTDLRVWILAGLAGGMTGISFWNHRVERFWKEANGFGLLDSTGDASERMTAVSRIGKAIQRQGEFFAQSQPPRAQVALLVNEDAYHFFQACNGDVIQHYRYNMRGWYARLWRMGVAVDFFDAEEVAAGELTQYKAAVLTMPLSLDGDYFAHLGSFVEMGGTLIAEACPGRWDKYGWSALTQLVAGGEELFGARHGALALVKEPGAQQRWMPEERRFGEFEAPTVLSGSGQHSSMEIRANFYLQTLLPTTAEPILTCGGEVAGVVNRIGAGHAILIGTFLGFGALAHRASDAGTDGFLAGLLRAAGVEGDCCGRLLRRRRQYRGQEAWFLVNPSARTVEESIPKDGFSGAIDLLGDNLIEESADTITVRVEGANLACVLLSP
ncbi:MAG: beta-galactosidase [Chloroflexi bacterium]|nr:beta-galactosidase [Chloroflexota bacterium]